jgi:hypothetical protein
LLPFQFLPTGLGLGLAPLHHTQKSIFALVVIRLLLTLDQYFYGIYSIIEYLTLTSKPKSNLKLIWPTID